MGLFSNLILLVITFCLSSLITINAKSSVDWPQKQVKIVVNFPPGSSPDILARALAPKLEQKFGQVFFIENHPGGGGIIGANYVAKLPSDGYTFLMSAGSTFAIDPYINKNQDTSYIQQLLPLASIAKVQLHLVANSNSPFENFESLTKFAKKNPGQLTYGSAGVGTGLHIAGELLNNYADIQTRHIPYQGSAQALQALLAGQIDFMFDPGISLSHIKAGKLRLLAIDSKYRSKIFPQTPTIKELGLKNFDASTTHGFFANKDIPPSILKTLHKAINEELKQKEMSDFKSFCKQHNVNLVIHPAGY